MGTTGLACGYTADKAENKGMAIRRTFISLTFRESAQPMMWTPDGAVKEIFSTAAL